MTTNISGNEFTELKGTENYIGTKAVAAKPMNRLEYNQFRGWDLPVDECADDKGYIVQYSDGYISWSPDSQFVDSYRPTAGMSFGLALEAIKKGLKVAREGWNGKDMWIAYSPGQIALPAEKFWTQANRDYAEGRKEGTDVLPCVTMKTEGGEILMGWLASQTDMFANDWGIID